MNRIWGLFFVSLWCSVHKIEVLAEIGLVFNTSVEKLDEISTADETKNCPLCMILCPAVSIHENQLIDHFAITKNCLFSHITYDKDEVAVDIKPNVCETTFKPSMIFDKMTKTYVVGYEIYYRENEVKLKSHKYNEFKGVTETVEIDNEKNYPSSELVELPALEIDDGENIKFVFPNGRTLVFYWIHILSFKFNPEFFQIRINLTGELDVVNDYQSMKGCGDYDLGYNFYTSEEKLYPFSREFHGSLVEAQLMPMMFLHTKAAKLGTCTHFNTIPVWKSIVGGQLELIDRYLYTIYRHYGSKVNIIFGVSGMQVVKVHTGDQIVPKIIYRIFNYKRLLKDNTVHTYPIASKKSAKSAYWNYYIVIIIHNNVEAVPKEERLCEKPEANDWKFLWNEEKIQAGLSYTCAPSIDLFDKLGAFDNVQTLTGSISNFHIGEVELELDLEKKVMKKEDARPIIDEEMEKFFGKKTQQK